MNDPVYNNLLKWGIQNSDASRNDASTASQPPPKPMSEGDREALAQIMSGIHGPSDAELMDRALQVVEHKEATAENKYIAFENFLLLIENIDNANNLESKDMWTRLVKQLDSEDPKIRKWAAWCCGVAVQNNMRSQERLLILGAIPTLARLATADTDLEVRKKATTALSSTVRNFQAALDAAIAEVPAEYKPQEKLEANDMESVDVLINKLRESL